jgi:hypothetical protein
MITYNLDGPNRSYGDIERAIQKLGTTWHKRSVLDSVWFVKSNLTAQQGYDRIAPSFEQERDYWFVVDIAGQSRQGWMPKDLWDYLSGF